MCIRAIICGGVRVSNTLIFTWISIIPILVSVVPNRKAWANTFFSQLRKVKISIRWVAGLYGRLFSRCGCLIEYSLAFRMNTIACAAPSTIQTISIVYKTNTFSLNIDFSFPFRISYSKKLQRRHVWAPLSSTFNTITKQLTVSMVYERRSYRQILSLNIFISIAEEKKTKSGAHRMTHIVEHVVKEMSNRITSAACNYNCYCKSKTLANYIQISHIVALINLFITIIT